jgi:glycosyltransferase involved in cell wall biosynthesis
LQREFGLRWVADFRDPVGYGKKHSAAGMLASAVEQKILARAMHSADLVTGLADSYGSIFFDLYGLPETRYRFIPTGLDENYLRPASMPTRDPGMLLHVGEVMPNQSRHTFAALARAHEVDPDAMAGFRLVFVGRREINAPLVAALTGSIPNWPYPVEFIDHLPQAEVYALIQRARACLLIPGRQRYWWTNFAKLVDYLALGTPVIADVPPVSEAREELGKAGNGFFLGGEDVETDARALLAWLRSDNEIRANDYGRRYTALRQAEAFAAVFDEVLAGGATR